MLNFNHLDPNSRPFEGRAWSHTAVMSCAFSLLARDLNMPSSGRPDRFKMLLRREEGSLQHDASELGMIALKQRGIWPNPLRVITKLLERYPVLGVEAAAMAEKHERWQNRFEFNIDNMVAREWKMAVDAEGNLCNYDNPPPGAWRVRIDWAEADGYRLRIIDYKNKPSIDSDSQLKRHEQLAGYAYALGRLSKKFRENPVTIGIYYYEYGVTKTVELSWEEIDILFERQRARMKARASLRVIDIRPEPGFGKCQYCDYVQDCPVGQEMLEQEQSAPLDPAMAVELAKRTFVLEELLKASKDALKLFAENFGPVAVDETMGYGFKPKTSTHVSDLPAMLKELKEAGVGAGAVMKFDHDAAKSLAKDNAAVEMIVDKYVTRPETGTIFSAYRPKEHKVKTGPIIGKKVKDAVAKAEKAEAKAGAKVKQPKSKKGKVSTPAVIG